MTGCTENGVIARRHRRRGDPGPSLDNAQSPATIPKSNRIPPHTHPSPSGSSLDCRVASRLAMTGCTQNGVIARRHRRRGDPDARVGSLARTTGPVTGGTRLSPVPCPLPPSLPTPCFSSIPTRGANSPPLAPNLSTGLYTPCSGGSGKISLGIVLRGVDAPGPKWESVGVAPALPGARVRGRAEGLRDNGTSTSEATPRHPRRWLCCLRHRTRPHQAHRTNNGRPEHDDDGFPADLR